jgi:hypothetical protein
MLDRLIVSIGCPEPTLNSAGAGGPASAGLAPRTYNDYSIPGIGSVDSTKYNPWRAPGHAPVADPWCVLCCRKVLLFRAAAGTQCRAERHTEFLHSRGHAGTPQPLLRAA